MKLYLDDIRNPHQTYPNDSDWFVVRNYNEFVSAIEKHFSDLEIISFDNDLANFDSGGVKDRYSPSVYGVGITGTKHPAYECGVQTKEYVLWNGMLESECHKTSFSNIAIEITKCSNSSYFSNNGAGLVVTVKNLGCENRKVKHLFDKE